MSIRHVAELIQKVLPSQTLRIGSSWPYRGSCLIWDVEVSDDVLARVVQNRYEQEATAEDSASRMLGL